MERHVQFSFILLILCILCSQTNASQSTRKLSNASVLCEHERNADHHGSSLIYIKAEGENDTIHYLYSSVGSFAIFTALTTLNATIHVNCTKFYSKNNTEAIVFNKTPQYTYIILFTNIYEFNDPKDKADISDKSVVDIKKMMFGDFSWENASITNNDDKIDVAFSIAGSNEYANKSLQLKMTASGSTSRSPILPRLVHTPNSTQVNFIFDKMNVSFENPRFAIEMLLIGKEPDSNFSLTSSSSLDDEFTPGVFKLIQVWSGWCSHGHLGAYAQWKPTVYTSETHARESSTATKENSLEFQNLKPVPNYITNSLANAVAENGFSKYFAQKLNITLGMAKDKFYTKTDYSSWTLATGYGVPPEDTISTLVVIVIAVGLGIPFLLLISGGIYIFVKRYRIRKDDLLLSD